MSTRKKIQANLQVNCFDQTLQSNAGSNSGVTVSCWKQAFVNYSNLVADIFGFLFFQIFSYLDPVKLEIFFEEVRSFYRSRNVRRVFGIQDDEFALIQKRYLHVYMVHSVFVIGHREWIDSGRITLFRIKSLCMMRDHRHNFLCVLANIFPQNDEKFSVDLGFCKYANGSELFISFFKNLFYLTYIPDGESRKDTDDRIGKSTILAPLLNEYGRVSEKTLQELQKITLEMSFSEYYTPCPWNLTEREIARVKSKKKIFGIPARADNVVDKNGEIRLQVFVRMKTELPDNIKTYVNFFS